MSTDIGAIAHRVVRTGAIRMGIAEVGEGPLVVLLHGFPETWYSWRHQLIALAGAGFHAVAPDQRGYGSSDRPERCEYYTVLDLVGDVVGLIAALGEQDAVIVGHDWGAALAWDLALMRPDLVRGVVALSVPYRQRGAGGSIDGMTLPTEAMRAAFGDDYYMVYFQQPGVADEELARDPRATLRRFLCGASGDAAEPWQVVLPKGGGFLDSLGEPRELPRWLTQADLDAYAAAFERGGFTGPLNWYRNIDHNWVLTRASWYRAPVLPAALFIGGDRDAVVSMAGGPAGVEALLTAGVPNLRDVTFLSGCGHWTQQERPDEVSAKLIEFAQGHAKNERRGKGRSRRWTLPAP